MSKWTIGLIMSCLCLAAFPALADDALLGAWRLATLRSVERGEDQQVTYTFTPDTLTVTVDVSGETTSWAFAYSVSEGEITIEPNNGLGEAKPLTYGYRVEDGRLTLTAGAKGEIMSFERLAEDG